MKGNAKFIYEQVDKHHDWFSKSIPMIASENIISPLARELLICDFHDRYAEGGPGERYYQGNIYVDEVEIRIQKLAEKLFDAQYSDVRPISGTVANMAVLMAFGGPDKKITSVDVSSGAHISSAPFGAVGLRGMAPITYPFNVEEMNIDVDGTRKMILEEKPDVALFGQSVFLFPTPIKELEDALQEAGSRVWYDGAHVLGLIAGGKFQDPLREGVEVMTGSTHKTLPGPQHGILIANPRSDEDREKLFWGMFPGVLSNHHLHAMAALGVTLAEHMEFGKEYARQIIKNAKALGQALYEREFDVVCPNKGFTESHTIAMDVREYGGGETSVEEMEEANLIANKNLMPWDDVDSAQEPSGIRLGSQELTRLGMKESHMDEVADFMKRVIIDGEDPKAVKKDVEEFRKDFQGIHYCYKEGMPAHKRFKFLDKY
ncbi:MAG: serine hydroxymethyltransferase [Thermoplasmata archaeon]